MTDDITIIIFYYVLLLVWGKCKLKTLCMQFHEQLPFFLLASIYPCRVSALPIIPIPKLEMGKRIYANIALGKCVLGISRSLTSHQIVINENRQNVYVLLHTLLVCLTVVFIRTLSKLL